METLQVGKNALEHVLQEAKENFGRFDANDMHLFVFFVLSVYSNAFVFSGVTFDHSVNIVYVVTFSD